MSLGLGFINANHRYAFAYARAQFGAVFGAVRHAGGDDEAVIARHEGRWGKEDKLAGLVLLNDRRPCGRARSA